MVQGILILYFFVTFLLLFSLETMYANGKLHEMISIESEEISKFISLDYGSKSWHLIIFLIGLLWLPLLIAALYQTATSSKENEEK